MPFVHLRIGYLHEGEGHAAMPWLQGRPDQADCRKSAPLASSRYLSQGTFEKIQLEHLLRQGSFQAADFFAEVVSREAREGGGSQPSAGSYDSR